MHESIYEPAEDSFLMSKIIKEKVKDKDIKFLEIGPGSGINLETAKEIGIKYIFSVDVNGKAVEHCKSLGFDCIQSNLFENVEGKFDLIIFNPPYLPEDKREDDESKVVTTGGKKGNEIIVKFLEQAKNHLEKNGKIFLITSSLSEEINFEKLGYKSKEMDSEKLFMEKLFLWELELI